MRQWLLRISNKKKGPVICAAPRYVSHAVRPQLGTLALLGANDRTTVMIPIGSFFYSTLFLTQLSDINRIWSLSV